MWRSGSEIVVEAVECLSHFLTEAGARISVYSDTASPTLHSILTCRFTNAVKCRAIISPFSAEIGILTVEGREVPLKMITDPEIVLVTLWEYYRVVPVWFTVDEQNCIVVALLYIPRVVGDSSKKPELISLCEIYFDNVVCNLIEEVKDVYFDVHPDIAIELRCAHLLRRDRHLPYIAVAQLCTHTKRCRTRVILSFNTNSCRIAVPINTVSTAVNVNYSLLYLATVHGYTDPAKLITGESSVSEQQFRSGELSFIDDKVNSLLV